MIPKSLVETQQNYVSLSTRCHQGNRGRQSTVVDCNVQGVPKKRTFRTVLAAPPNPPASIHILQVNIQIHPAKI